MCRDLTNHNNKVSMGVTPIKIKTRTRAEVGVIIRAIKTMDGGIIITVCHHPSEQTAIREKNGLGRSTSSDTYFPYSLYELNKGEYAKSINPTE